MAEQENFCPTCHSRIGDQTTRQQGDEGVDADGNPIPRWTGDSVLTRNGFSGPEFIGQQRTGILAVFEELQEDRIALEEEAGFTEEQKTKFSELSKQHIRNTHLIELRESTEKLLENNGSTLEEYFKTDADGNEALEPGPNDTFKSEWTDVERGRLYIRKDGTKSGTFTLPSGVEKDSPSIPANTRVRAIHIEDLRRFLSPGFFEYFSVTPSGVLTGFITPLDFFDNDETALLFPTDLLIRVRDFNIDDITGFPGAIITREITESNAGWWKSIKQKSVNFTDTYNEPFFEFVDISDQMSGSISVAADYDITIENTILSPIENFAPANLAENAKKIVLKATASISQSGTPVPAVRERSVQSKSDDIELLRNTNTGGVEFAGGGFGFGEVNLQTGETVSPILPDLPENNTFSHTVKLPRVIVTEKTQFKIRATQKITINSAGVAEFPTTTFIGSSKDCTNPIFSDIFPPSEEFLDTFQLGEVTEELSQSNINASTGIDIHFRKLESGTFNPIILKFVFELKNAIVSNGFLFDANALSNIPPNPTLKITEGDITIPINDVLLAWKALAPTFDYNGPGTIVPFFLKGFATATALLTGITNGGVLFISFNTRRDPPDQIPPSPNFISCNFVVAKIRGISHIGGNAEAILEFTAIRIKNE